MLIKEVKKRSNYYLVTIDDQTLIILTHVFKGKRLIEGESLSDGEFSLLKNECEKELALKKAIDKLSIRERSCAEVRTFLRKEFSLRIVDYVLSILVEKRFVDDMRYTQLFTEHAKRRHYGPVRIKTELKKRGISDEMIADVLTDSADYLQDMVLLANKTIKSFHGSQRKLRDKLLRTLAQKGFADGVYKVVNDLVDGYDESISLEKDMKKYEKADVNDFLLRKGYKKESIMSIGGFSE